MYYNTTKQQLQDNYKMEDCKWKYIGMKDKLRMSDEKVPKILPVKPL
jgi:hypothetical protein